jgi:hypothetical protein
VKFLITVLKLKIWKEFEDTSMDRLSKNKMMI